VAAILALVLGALTLTGCGGLVQNNNRLLLANIGWDENVAVSNLTKVLLEDELGYERVDISTSENLGATYRRVASGEVDAFQDVWLPNQEAKLDQVAEDVEHLDPWFLGKTKQGMAVPAYMDVRSIDQLNDTDAQFIFGIEPSSVMMHWVGGRSSQLTASSKNWLRHPPRACSTRSSAYIPSGMSSSSWPGRRTG
jgi:glycine betaine/proline transport system substrate-binding protein